MQTVSVSDHLKNTQISIPLYFCCRDVFRQSPHVKSASGVTDVEHSSVNTVSRLFLLQCDAGDANPELIACARYNIFNEYSQILESQLEFGQQQRIHIVFIIQLPRIPGGCFAGFQVTIREVLVFIS